MTDTPNPRPIRRIFTEAARKGGDFTLHDSGLRITDILDELDRDGDDAVLARHAGKLSPRDLDVCRSVAAHHMPDRPEYKNNGGGSPLCILFDENIPHRIIPKLLNGDCRLSHISFNGLTTATDSTIWLFAKTEGFKALLTRDTDFLRIIETEILDRLHKAGNFDAVTMDDLPLVVHINSKNRNDILANHALLKTNLQRIAAITDAQPRAFASITLGVNGQGAAQTVRDIYRRYMKPSIRETLPDTPAFDKALLNHEYINRLRARYDMPDIRFSQEQKWADFNTRTCAMLRARKQTGPSAPQV